MLAGVLAVVGLTLAAPLAAEARPPVAPPGPGSFTLWHDVALPPGAVPMEMVVASTGTVWFADGSDDHLASLDPSTGLVTEVPGTTGSFVSSLVEGVDGAIWYSDPSAALVRRIDPASRVVTDFGVPAPVRPLALTAAPDGSVWFGTSEIDTIGHVSAAHGVDLVTVASDGGQPVDIAWGPDGRLWMTQYGVFAVDAYDPATGAVASYPLSSPAATEVEVGSDGAIWLAASDLLHRVEVGGAEEFSTVPGATFAMPFSLRAGGAGILYADTEGRILTAGAGGAFTPLGPGGAGHLPVSISRAPDGALWYSDPVNGRLAWG